MIRNLLSLLLFTSFLNSHSQNLQLEANIPYPYRLSNIAGYQDTASNEYALVGTYEGLDIVDVTTPSNPSIKFTIPGIESNWREVKTYRKYAYITTEGEIGGTFDGLIIVDLSNLPDTVYYQHYYGDSTISNQLGKIHALHCDTATGYLYLYGSTINNGATIFLDLSDPWNPTYAGTYINNNDPYVHDGYVENDTMYEGHIYTGFFTIVDVTDKANPVLLGQQTTPTAFTHNTWLSDDHKTLFTTDENSNSYLAAYDVSDPANIQELSRFQTAPGSGAIVHNTHILNDYAITSWYKEGVVITDVSRPHNPVEVGHYDTYQQGSGSGFNGCWGVYPFLPSGTIVASDIDNGLFVLTPTYIRGCYLEGIVTDSASGQPVNNALVEILTTTITQNTGFQGEFNTGTVNAGMYDVRISKAGYVTQTITGVQLTNGVVTPLNVLLVPLQSSNFTGLISDSLTAQGLSNAVIYLEGGGLNYSATSSANGSYTLTGVIPGTYYMFAGKWGYRTRCSFVTLTPGIPPTTIELQKGYEDDFTFDFGWSVSGISLNAWQRGEPEGTYNNFGQEINPELDVTGDCGEKCFVTDNGGAPFNSHDVDDGNTVLTSPVFDATIYSNPVMSYYRRYLCIDGQGTPNDTMIISLTNGVSTIRIEEVEPDNPSNGQWVQSVFPLQGMMTLTANMRLIVEVMDDDSIGNIVEGALDQFDISGTILSSVTANNDLTRFVNIYPNPFISEITISYDLSSKNGLSELLITDLTGRVVEKRVLANTTGKISAGKSLSPGIYLLLIRNSGLSYVEKIIKQ